MKNKAMLIQRLESWPEDKWCQDRLQDDQGRRCAVGIALGNDLNAETPIRMEEKFTEIYGFPAWMLEGVNDLESTSLESVIDYVKSLKESL